MVNYLKRKLSQGEIFGIALLFVVIILGFLVYAKIGSVKGFQNDDILQEGQYKILAEGTLNTVLEASTGCYVENNRDTLKDVINFCLENSRYPYDAPIECVGVVGEKNSCELVLKLINESLFYMYNNSDSSKGIANIPFEFRMDLPSNANTYLSNKSFTNFGTFEYKGTIINDTNKGKYNYKRAPSGLIAWATSQRSIEFELYLYYK